MQRAYSRPPNGMRTTTGAIRTTIALVALAFCAPVPAVVQLEPLVTGLSSPVFVAHAGDGSNRLFVVEQNGVVRVAQSIVDLGGTVSRLVADDSCRSAIAPAHATFAKAGGAGSITVTTDKECAWTAATSDAWITLGGAGGNGDGTITYTVAPYAGKPKTRIGSIAIAGMTFTITQNRLRLRVRAGGASDANGVAGPPKLD